MKKYLCILLAFVVLLSLAACGGKDSGGTADTGGSTEEDTSAGNASDTPDTAQDTTPPEPTVVFSDVPESAFYYDAAMWAAENGLVSGDKFDPMGICNRGQMLTLLWRAMGSPEPAGAENPFTDGDPSSWFYKPALWAYETGIISAGAVSANGACPMGQLLTILWRANGSPITAAGVSAVANKYPGQYYEKALAWADLCGLLNAIGQAFDPNASCTRATVVLYLYWLKDNFSLSAEDAAVQAEYAKLVADAPLYGVTGDGLVYADYIDVEGDGKVELLTVGVEPGRDGNTPATATVYANVGGHAEKTAEISFEWSDIHTTYVTVGSGYLDGRFFLRCDEESLGNQVFDHSSCYYIENGQFTAFLSASYDSGFATPEDPETWEVSGQQVTEAEYDQAMAAFPAATAILRMKPKPFSVERSGLLPSAAEIRKMQMDAIRNGDFTMVAGEYEPTPATKEKYYEYKSITLHADGRVTGYEADYYTSGTKPVSINVDSQGVITCVVIPAERYVAQDLGDGDFLYDWIGEQYQIFPDADGGYDRATINYETLGGGVWAPTFIRVSN